MPERDPHWFLDKALNSWEEKDGRAVFKFREISVLETSKLLLSLSNSVATGHDRLDSMGIKGGGISLITPLRHLINTSLVTGKVAMKWKFLALSPRLKSKELNKFLTSLYRPIAQLPTISKLVERAAQQQLLQYFEESGQLNPSGHAYRKNLSTTTTLAEITDEIYQGAEEKKLTSIMQIDQSAAFDVINHKFLLEKLERYNIGLEARTWIENYLKFRSQYVVIGRSHSRMVPVTRGVPQGSVIGPILLAIYTNEITEVIKQPGCQNIAHQNRKTLWGLQCNTCGLLTQYADDITYTVSSRSRIQNQNNLKRNLNELSQHLNDQSTEYQSNKDDLDGINDRTEKGENYWNST